MRPSISCLDFFLISLVILSLATGFVESRMTPRIAFPLVTKRFTSKKYNAQKNPARIPVKTFAKVTRTKVVTDIDDTVKSSGGAKLFGIPLGGIDVRISKSEVTSIPTTTLLTVVSYILLHTDSIPER